MKEQIKHYDILGDELKLGSYVSATYEDCLTICLITKICNKTVYIKPVIGTGKPERTYSNETILISGQSALAYILKHAGN